MLSYYVCVSVGNILVIVIVAATKTFHCVTSVLIMNLAISDLLVGVGVMPFIALSIMNNGWVDCTVRLIWSFYSSVCVRVCVSVIDVIVPLSSHIVNL
jgi:hypothetical protein